MKGGAKTPLQVLFDALKRHFGISHKDAAGVLLSDDPVLGGRSPRGRKDDRTWLSRFIVHAQAGAVPPQCFNDFAASAVRFAARAKARDGQLLAASQVSALVCGEVGRAMENALEHQGEDPLVFRNFLTRVGLDGSLSPAQKAEVALVALVAAGCSASSAAAVSEAQRFAAKNYGGAIATPPAEAPDDGAPFRVPPQAQPRWIGLLRVENGAVIGAPHWVNPTGRQVEVGSLALSTGAITEVGSDVSAVHLRVWHEDGGWWVQGTGSCNGTVIVRAHGGQRVVVEAPQREGRSKDSPPLPLYLGDALTLGASTTFVVIEGYPEAW